MVLTRVVPADGRSRAYVDGRPATAAPLAEVTAGIVDLHGQHAHQSLLGVGRAAGRRSTASATSICDRCARPAPA